MAEQGEVKVYTEERRVIRCGNCELNQFMTCNGLCRKCRRPLRWAACTTEQVDPKPETAAAPQQFEPISLAQAIAHKVRERRRKIGISQTATGKAMKSPRTYLGKVENARRIPTIKTLGRIALALNCEITDLLPTPEEQAVIDKRSGGGDSFMCELASHVQQLQESDRYLLLRAALSMKDGQGFMLETMTV